MYTAPIDDEGYIENPYVVNVSAFSQKKLWCGITYRRGKKIVFPIFLPSADNGRKIDVSGVARGVYLVFGLANDPGRLIYVVDQVEKNYILLRSVEVSEVPRVYDIELTTPNRVYILEAKLAMLAEQMCDLQGEMMLLKETVASSVG
ncbi:hypothetical protein [Pseudomonas triticifolii]|uniref:Uncharacterized protein n=1 Tax=Pseudomonas triticifolii TaxID=2762592 RepID=A0ABR7BIW9_9PSED|nr:hypothetical protein [Pseudomonas triticifolii]MBC3957112.1 hypothetical protein [Pseudomonas triticifolii]